MTDRRRHTGLIAAVLLLASLVVGGIVYFGVGREVAREDADQAERKAQTAEGYAADVVIACENQGPKGRALRAAGACPDARDVVEGSDQSSLSAEEQVEIGRIARQVLDDQPSLSLREVAEEVLSRIDPPRDGRDGRSVTEAEVLRLLAGLYAENPPQDGQDGADSTVPGPRGPSCVEELGLEQCRGPIGPGGQDGQDGQDGAPGRGIETTYCDQDTQQIVVVYTDGTSEPMAGSDCVADLLGP